MTTTEFQLEQLIDERSLPEVLEMIQGICYEKAQHIEANYQDKTLARLWTQMGNKLQPAINHWEATPLY